MTTDKTGFRVLRDNPDPAVFSESQMSYVLERVDSLTVSVEGLRAGLQHSVALGVQEGIRALVADPDFGEKFWRAGFERLSAHAGDASSRWLGSRMLTAAVLAIVSAGIAWLVKTGRI